MMKSKGFTLIELLAVIVILAIIALIATPIVLGIIEDSRENTNKVSAQYIVDMVEKAYSIAYTDNMGSTPTVEDISKAFKMSGAEWRVDEDTGEQQIVSSNGEVVCSVDSTTTSGELKVICKDSEGNPFKDNDNKDIATETMEISQ